MKTINSAITTAEAGNIQIPRDAIWLEDGIVKFSTKQTGLINGSLDLEVPPAIESAGTASNNVWAAYRNSSGTIYLRYLRANTGTDWDLTFTGTATLVSNSNVASMRCGSTSHSGVPYMYYADNVSGNIQVKRVNLSSLTVNPVSWLDSNFGPSISGQLSYTFADKTSRVEAVLPVESGVIVIVGKHDEVAKTTRLYFYWVTSTTQRLLNTTVEASFTETIANWYGFAKQYSHACAYEENGIVYIYFNSNASGRMCYFTLQNGIESSVETVVSIDPEETKTAFTAQSISKINGYYYMAGRLSVTEENGSSVAFDLYLTSDDLKNWSIGERSSFCTASKAKGKIMLVNNYLYYVGNLFWARANPTSQHDPGGPNVQRIELTNNLNGWTLSSTTNSADSASFAFSNSNFELETGIASVAQTIQFYSGQDSTLSQIGIYGIDSKSKTVNISGNGIKTVSARDLGFKKLIDWQSPVDIWLDGSYRFYSDLKKDNGLIIKTKATEKDATFTEGAGFVYNGLSSPYMFLFDAPFSNTTIIKTSVTNTVSIDPYHVSVVGFVLGGYEDEDGNFKGLVLCVPKKPGLDSTPFTGFDNSQLRKFNLVPIDTEDPDKINTGLNYTRRLAPLWKNLTGHTTAITTTVSQTEEVATIWQIPYEERTDLMARVDGRFIELYSKKYDRAASTWVSNSEWVLRYRTAVSNTETIYPPKKSWGGIIVSTDVSGSDKWFAQAKYGDMITQISAASPYLDWTVAPGGTNNCQRQHDATRTFSNVHASLITKLASGMKIKVQADLIGTTDYTINTVTPGTPNQFTVTTDIPLGPSGENNYSATVYLQATSTDFGYVGAGYKKVREATTGNITFYDTGATKRATLATGRGVIITDDATALSQRWMETDGVNFILKSGSTGFAGATYLAFDGLTTPETNPSKWRVIMFHGALAEGAGNDYDMLTNGYVKVNDEIIRYYSAQALRRGYYPGDTPVYNKWIAIPTAYAPVQSATKGNTVLVNWKSYLGALPGDQFDTLGSMFGASANGLLVEIITKDNNSNRDNDTDEAQPYVASTVVSGTYGSPTAPAITLTAPLKTHVFGAWYDIDNPSTTTQQREEAATGDIAVISGRAQFNTKKEKHNEDDPVVYYPCDTSGNVASIKLHQVQYYDGNITTTEDIIKRVIALPGVRGAKARTAFSSAPYLSQDYVVDLDPVGSATNLPLQEDMADFTIDLNAYIPGNNISGGSITNRNELQIYFRNKYCVSIEQYNTNADISGGTYLGNLKVRLWLTTGELTASGGETNLEAITVRNVENISGTYSGSSGNYTLSAVISRKNRIRLNVQGSFVSVEINGKKIIDFNLEDYKTDGGTDLKSLAAAPIKVCYKNAIASNGTSIRVQGIGDNNPGFAIRKTSSAKSALDDLIGDRHVFTRSTETGSIEFGQFYNRDYFGNLHVHLVSDTDTYSDEQVIGHMEVTGNESSGSYIDEDWLIGNGYRFSSISNQLMTETSESIREAKLQVRRQKEESYTRNVSGLGRLALQPEDEVDVTHAKLASARYVITDISLSKDGSTLNGDYTVRIKY